MRSSMTTLRQVLREVFSHSRRWNKTVTGVGNREGLRMGAEHRKTKRKVSSHSNGGQGFKQGRGNVKRQKQHSRTQSIWGIHSWYSFSDGCGQQSAGRRRCKVEQETTFQGLLNSTQISKNKWVRIFSICNRASLKNLRWSDIMIAFLC